MHIFTLLGDRRRRLVLIELQRSAQLTLDELATAVAAREAAIPADEVPSHDAKRVAVSLHHTALPACQEAGVVEYDERKRVVRPGPRFERVEPHLESVVESLE